jgi:dipeptidase E
MTRSIVAMGGGGFTMGDPILDRYILGFVDAARPRVCFLPTGASNVATYVVRFLDAFPSTSFQPTYLDLFDRSITDLEGFLREQDVIYVGGGNTANMLAIWRVHGVDRALSAAWRDGVICCGVSAGANCWFEASTTDSYLVGTADPLLDGLGFLPGAFCPHYDESPRRERFHELVASGALPPGVACDDFAAVRFGDAAVVESVISKKGAGAYRVTLRSGGVTEERLETRLLS